MNKDIGLESHEAQEGQLFTLDGIMEFLFPFLEGRGTRVLTTETDEKGLLYAEIEITDAIVPVVTFARESIPSRKMDVPIPTLVVTYYEDGRPIGGKLVATYEDGEWKVSDAPKVHESSLLTFFP